MANYYDNSTSNKFKVKQSEKERLEKVFENLIGDDVYTDVVEKDGEISAWFGCYGSLTGLDVENYFEGNQELIDIYKDDEYNAMADELQKCITDDSYVILTDVGHEKLRYVGGGALVITPNKSDYVSLDIMAMEKLKELSSKA